MAIIIKRIFPSSCHFLHVRSKYLLHHPILEYLQPLFVCQHGRPSFTPICNIRRNYSYLIKRSSKYYVICRQRKKFNVQKSNSSNYNSTFSVLSVFNTQTVRHLKTPAIFLYIYDRRITFFMKAL